MMWIYLAWSVSCTGDGVVLPGQEENYPTVAGCWEYTQIIKIRLIKRKKYNNETYKKGLNESTSQKIENFLRTNSCAMLWCAI